ncbi:fatty acid desaturase [Phenylobacterium sp.]|jgi:fatty acid desaturase|uniref:fatty acid desaturase family protein n=1 Tax=Phenylobacterium sp. TaxID=1871053 RepID=UPI002F3FCD6B
MHSLAAGPRVAAEPAIGRELVAEARRLTDDLTRPSRAVYWTDLALTVLAVFAALAAAVLGRGWARAAGAAVGVLALYRALSFIHELTHLRRDELPGFRFAWNALVGVPFLVPSFLYEGVHNVHHTQQRYGTADDPEYLPLSHGSAAALLGFAGVALLAPLGAFLRFAVVAPLSVLVPRLRPAVVGRLSAMAINPGFERRDVSAARTPAWRAQEIACWLWSWTLVALVLSGGLRSRAVLTGAAILAAATCVNQLRTLVAHAWASHGEVMSLEDQFRDSVNVPPPGWLPALWAPVGLRYHALHHLAPRVPYHNLAEAHRRLAGALATDSAYYAAQYRGFGHALGALVARTRARPRP